MAASTKPLLAGLAVALVALVAAQSALAVITVQIGGATRLNSITRNRDRYSCYWDCDLVGCQIARDDDECAYDCERICRVRYDYAGRSGAASGATSGAPSAEAHLQAKSAALEPTGGAEAAVGGAPEVAAPTTLRLHLPRNASARNFGFWERCGEGAPSGGQQP